MAMAIAIASANGSATFIEATDHPRWFGSQCQTIPALFTFDAILAR